MSNEIILKLDEKKIVVLGVLFVAFILISSSYLTALLAFNAPSPDFPLNVNQVETLDDATNTTKTLFDEGETVRINVTIEKALQYLNFPFSYDYFDFSGDTTFRVVARVMDDISSPVFFAYDWVTISVGGIETIYFDYTILSNSRPGEYQVSILLWSDWLESGEALAVSAGEVNFNVN